MNKRGLNQLDWAVSLGIFLLYLAWFFIFIKPQIEKASDLSPLAGIIKDNIDEETYTEIEKTPIFIRSEMIRNASIILVNISTDKFYIPQGKDYFYHENRILFLEDLNNDTKLFYLVESNNTYVTQANTMLDIIVEGEKITTSKDFEVVFSDGEIKNVSYKNNKVMQNTILLLNGAEFKKTSTNFTNHNILAEYSLSSQSIDIYERVIAKNSVLWLYIESKDLDNPQEMTISTEITGFDMFFSDNTNNGNITDDSCESYTSDFLRFSDTQDSLSFLLPENTNIAFCVENRKASLNISFDIEDNSELFIVLDNASFEREEFTDYEIIEGIRKTVDGIDITSLNDADYDTKKAEWGIPSQNDFQVIIWNSTRNDYNRTDPIIMLGNEPITTKDVFAEEYTMPLLDPTGEYHDVTVSVKTW